MKMAINPDKLNKARSSFEALKPRMETVIRGKPEVIDMVLVCLLGRGHLFLEDLPGMGKTTLAYALARALDGSFQRIQFTSDLLPVDVLGGSAYSEKLKDFEFKKGPVFANFILADEINRTTPKTQSALLEVVDRGRVSIGGETHEVGRPFMVFATQNPVDFEGTFPLPDSQMDRFFMRMEMGYPATADELELLRTGSRHYDELEQEPIVSLDEVHQWQSLVKGVFMEDSLLGYMLHLVTATRSESTFQCGISPRGALALKLACQARALYQGREYVIPRDVQALLVPVCGHRLKTTSHGSDPMEERRWIESVLTHILDAPPVPR
jgi:MoxR-like ATPase